MAIAGKKMIFNFERQQQLLVPLLQICSKGDFTLPTNYMDLHLHLIAEVHSSSFPVMQYSCYTIQCKSLVCAV